MINEFIDYTLEPSLAWSKKRRIALTQGDLLIEYGANCLINLTTEEHSFSYWNRATLFPKDRYMPSFTPQKYYGNRSESIRNLFAAIREIL